MSCGTHFIQDKSLKVKRVYYITMQALQWNATESTFTKIRTEIPQVTDGTVLVKVSHAGICGSDLHVIENKLLSGDLVILGHEFSGIVSKVGTDIEHVKVGSRVVVEVKIPCNYCKFCRRGKINACCSPLNTIGFTRDGGLAEYCLVPEKYVHPIPDTLPLDIAALVEPTSCIIHIYESLGPIEEGSKILVMGAGTIGIILTSMLHAKGFRNVTVVEINEKRRKIVEEAHFDFDILHPNELQTKMRNIDAEADGFEIIVDCTGSPKALEMAFNMISNGGKICMFGLPSKTDTLTVTITPIIIKELTIIGVVFSPNCFPKGINLVNDMADRYLVLKKIGMEKFSIDQWESAFDKMRRGEITKAILCLDSEIK